MDEDAPHQMRWPHVVARVVAYAVLTVMLYPLSFGPVYWLLAYRSTDLDQFLIEKAYGPVFWLGREGYDQNLLNEYRQWWDALPGGLAERRNRQMNPQRNP